MIRSRRDAPEASSPVFLPAIAFATLAVLATLAAAVPAARAGSPGTDAETPADSAATMVVSPVIRSPLPPGAAVVDGVAAIVGRDVILLSDVEERLRFFEAQLSPADRDTLDLGKIRGQILESMIDDNLLVTEATHAGVEVTTGEVTDGVEKAVARVRANFPSQEAFESELAREGMDISALRQSYRDIVRRQLLTQRVVQREIYAKVQVKEDELRDWFEQHRAEIPEVPAQVVVDHIVVAPRPSPEAEHAAAGKLDEIRKHLAAGENFAQVAKQFSEAPGADRGGSMGTFGHGDLHPSFAAAESVAFTLDVGEVSEPVRTPLGLHLIHLDEKSGERVRASQILVKLEATAADSTAARERAERVASEARGGKPFDELARAASDDLATAANGGRIGSFSLQELTPLYREPLATAKEGDIIGPLETPDGFQILRLVSRSGERPPSFEEVAGQLRQNLMEVKAREKYLAWVADLRQKIYIRVMRTGEERG